MIAEDLSKDHIKVAVDAVANGMNLAKVMGGDDAVTAITAVCYAADLSMRDKRMTEDEATEAILELARSIKKEWLAMMRTGDDNKLQDSA